MIFTDTTASKAKEIAEENRIQYYCNDIKEYYRQKGYSDRKDMEARKDYDRQTAQILKKQGIELVALCGYMSIITEDPKKELIEAHDHLSDALYQEPNLAKNIEGLATYYKQQGNIPIASTAFLSLIHAAFSTKDREMKSRERSGKSEVSTSDTWMVVQNGRISRGSCKWPTTNRKV